MILKKLSSFGVVRLFDISYYSPFRQFSYFFFDINLFRSFSHLIFHFIFYVSYFRNIGLSTFERSLIFNYETSAVLKFYCCSKFGFSSSKMNFKSVFKGKQIYDIFSFSIDQFFLYFHILQISIFVHIIYEY